jgi:hypothetical protein
MAPADAQTQRVDLAASRLVVEGPMFWRKRRLPTPFAQIVFRLLTLTVGRFAPNLTRSLLQKILITGKPKAPATFRREIVLRDDAIEVTDEIALAERLAGGSGGASRVTDVAFGPDATSIYVANSNTFQRSVLLPWAFDAEAVASLNTSGRATIRRAIETPRRR